jgi:hypothetical protein
MTHNNTPAKHYHELTIIQKINVKANVSAYGTRWTSMYDFRAMRVALNDLKTWQYDTPYYFSGSNPLY